MEQSLKVIKNTDVRLTTLGWQPEEGAQGLGGVEAGKGRGNGNICNRVNKKNNKKGMEILKRHLLNS